MIGWIVVVDQAVVEVRILMGRLGRVLLAYNRLFAICKTLLLLLIPLRPMGEARRPGGAAVAAAMAAERDDGERHGDIVRPCLHQAQMTSQVYPEWLSLLS